MLWTTRIWTYSLMLVWSSSAVDVVARGFSPALGCSAGEDAWGTSWLVRLSTLALVVARAVVSAPRVWMTSFRVRWSLSGFDSSSSDGNCGGFCDLLLFLTHCPLLGVEGLFLGAIVLNKEERNTLERSALLCHYKSSEFKGATFEPAGC